MVKSLYVGICGTDKAFYLGSYDLLKKPLVPGHEVVGLVVEGCEELKGAVVVPEINFSCLKCPTCLSGMYTHCPHKKTLGIDFDGGLAEYFVAPPWALHRIENLDPMKAVFVEPLAALIHGLRMMPPLLGSKCAIIGTGTLAYLLAQLLKVSGASEITVVARKGSVKAKKFSEMGFNVVSLEDSERLSSKFDVVFDVSGSPNALDVAVTLAKPRGIIHVKSTPGARFTINMTWAVVKELQFVCSRCGTHEEFEEAIRLLKRGLVEPPPLTLVEGLDNAVQAFEMSLRRDVFKVVIKI